MARISAVGGPRNQASSGRRTMQTFAAPSAVGGPHYQSSKGRRTAKTRSVALSAVGGPRHQTSKGRRGIRHRRAIAHSTIVAARTAEGRTPSTTNTTTARTIKRISHPTTSSRTETEQTKNKIKKETYGTQDQTRQKDRDQTRCKCTHKRATTARNLFSQPTQVHVLPHKSPQKPTRARAVGNYKNGRGTANHIIDTVSGNVRVKGCQRARGSRGAGQQYIGRRLPEKGTSGGGIFRKQRPSQPSQRGSSRGALSECPVGVLCNFNSFNRQTRAEQQNTREGVCWNISIPHIVESRY